MQPSVAANRLLHVAVAGMSRHEEEEDENNVTREIEEHPPPPPFSPQRNTLPYGGIDLQNKKRYVNSRLAWGPWGVPQPQPQPNLVTYTRLWHGNFEL